MANDGHVLLDALGRRMMRDDGSLDICEECCGCVRCSGETPETVTLVVSGVNTYCTECLASDATTKLTGTPDVSPNGTFILTRVSYPRSCRWEYRTPVSGCELTYYEDLYCNVFSNTKELKELGFRLSAGLQYWTLTIQYLFEEGDSIGQYSVGYAFLGNSSTITMCDDATFSTNVITSCTNILPTIAIAYGGSASLTV